MPINLYITSLNESNNSATFLPFSPLLLIAIPNNIDTTIKAIKLSVDNNLTNWFVDNTLTVLSNKFNSTSSAVPSWNTSCIAAVSSGLTKSIAAVEIKPIMTAIIDVIKNITIVLIRILLSLFGSCILEIDDVIVKNINGTIITNKRFKNKSPSGLTISAFSLKIKPQIAPMITQPKRIIVLL